jgi:hypothetical protein
VLQSDVPTIQSDELIALPIRRLGELSGRAASLLIILATQCLDVGNGRICLSPARMRSYCYWAPHTIDRVRNELMRNGLLAVHTRGRRGARHLYRFTWMPPA